MRKWIIFIILMISVNGLLSANEIESTLLADIVIGVVGFGIASWVDENLD